MSECYNFNTFAAVSVVNQIFQIKLVITQTMKNYVKALLLTTVLFGVNIVGGVKATVVTGANGPVGTLPSCITNLKYEDYSLFVNSKDIKITWTPSGNTDGCYLVYYLAEEDKSSWYQQRVYWYTKNYAVSGEQWDESNGKTPTFYQRRMVHLDQGPKAAEGKSYTTFYESDLSSSDDWSYDPNVSQSGIGWVMSMNPFLVGRAVKWDDPTYWDDEKTDPVIKKVPLSEGKLEIANVSKSTIVFFNFVDAAGNYYAGPDKLTNSQAAADRHSPMSLLPWNQCYISAHLNVPMPLKILWRTEQNGDYTEVPAGTDVVFPTKAYVKFEWNTDFISKVQNAERYDLSSFLSNLSSFKIYYTTNSLLPIGGAARYGSGSSDTPETYENSTLTPKEYDINGTPDPIEITANTVLRFAIYKGSEMYLGQDDKSGNINAVLSSESLKNEGNKYMVDYENSRYNLNANNPVALKGAGKASEGSSESINDLGGSSGYIPPIQNYLRNNCLWDITFIKSGTRTISKSFGNPVPFTSWSENISGRYGLGTGTYSYETWVSDGNYLVPSSLEGICDFFIVSQNSWQEVSSEITGNENQGIYLSRINWIPKGMPVLVRYRNYSQPNSLPTDVRNAIDRNQAVTEAELESGLYFHSSTENHETYGNVLKYGGVLKAIFENDLNEGGGLSETQDYEKDDNAPSTWQYDINGQENNGSASWTVPETDQGGNRLYFYMGTDGYGSSSYPYSAPLLYRLCVNGDQDKPLFMVWDDNNNRPYVQKNDGTNLYYHKVDKAGNKLYHQVDEEGDKLYKLYGDYDYNNQIYYKVDTNGETLYQEVDANGYRLYDDGNGGTTTNANSSPRLKAANTPRQETDDNNNPLYYQYDGDNQLYHEVDDSGNKMYYRPILVKDVLEKTYILVYHPNNAPEGVEALRGGCGESEVETVKEEISHYGTFIKLYPEKITEAQFNSGGQVDDVDSWKVKTTEVTDYPLTTTIANSHPVMVTDPDYPAYTTENTGYPVYVSENNIPSNYYINTNEESGAYYDTTPTDYLAETTVWNNSEYENEDGYVYTICAPIIDTESTENYPIAYTLEDTGHPAFIADNYYYEQSSYSRDWIGVYGSPYPVTESSHVEGYNTVNHVPIYTGASEPKFWDLGGNYYTDIRSMSAAMLALGTKANGDFTAEPHTFELYPGNNDISQYDKETFHYHIGPVENKDEGNFLNLLRYSTEPFAATGYEYGFTYDHKNEFHPANSSVWAAEFFNSGSGTEDNRDYVFGKEENSSSSSRYSDVNVGLHLYPFLSNYNYLCTSKETISSYGYTYDNSYEPMPIVDNWLVYAPNNSRSSFDDGGAHHVLAYYCGFGPSDNLRKQTLVGSSDAYDNTETYTDANGNDQFTNADPENFGGWTSAAWKRVKTGSTIAANRPYLYWDGSNFVDPSQQPGYDDQNQARFVFTAGGGLSLLDAIENRASGETTGVKSISTSQISTDNAVYDLQGRRVADSMSAVSGKLAKGVYIVNGVKRVIK